MGETTVSSPPKSEPHAFLGDLLSRQQVLDLYYYMRLTREVENRAIVLYRQGRLIGALYTAHGNEAVAVGSAFALEDGDVVAPLHRDMGVHLVRGTALAEVFAHYMGRAGTSSRGKDGSLHIGSRERRIFPLISHLGAMIPMTAGAALASKITRQGYVAMTYIGDGATSIGDFHEAVNFAAVQRLPFVLVIENNQYAYSTPLSLQFACENLADRARGYGIPGEVVDGTDVIAVYETCKRALDRARAGEGPTLIETRTMRLRGHSEHDDASYVPRKMLDEWKKKDPIDRFERVLYDHGMLTDDLKKQTEQRIMREIDEAVASAEARPMPAPEETLTGVYAE